MMSFGDAIAVVFRKYAEFTGRARRPEFWWWVLFTSLVSAAINAFAVVRVGDVVTVGGVLSGVWGVAVLVPSLAVTVRRLRDSGYGWANLFWMLLPLAGLIVLIVLLAQPTRENAIRTAPTLESAPPPENASPPAG